MRRVDSLEKTLMLGGIGGRGEGDDRGWDGWMASLTQWTWVSVNSGSWWCTGRPGMLRFMESQKVRHDWVTDLIWCKFWQLYGGIIGILLREDLCHSQVCCTQSSYLCGSPLLTCTSTGDTQTQFCLSLCGVSVSSTDWGKQIPVLEGTNKTLCAQRIRGKEQWFHRKLN